jgi:hypothetical protein
MDNMFGGWITWMNIVVRGVLFMAQNIIASTVCVWSKWRLGKMDKNKDIKNTDFNTIETVEYHQWVRLLEEVCLIQLALKENQNTEGLKQARSAAYNVLADIQMLVDALEHKPQYIA